MSAVSSYVNLVYSPKATGRSASTRYELVGHPCWLRGLYYYMAGSPTLGTSSQTLQFYNTETPPVGEAADTLEDCLLRVPCSSEAVVTQTLFPGESYIKFDNSIWVLAINGTVIQQTYIGLFIS